jgi:hypothetical protein
VRVRARVHLVGVESPSTYAGLMVRVEPTIYRLASPGGSVTRPGTSVVVDAMTSWGHAERACELAELVISAAIDFSAMVFTRGSYSIIVGRTTCPAPTLEWPWRAYELLNWMVLKDDLPYTVRLSDRGVRRIGEMIECALTQTASSVWAITDGMAAAERAAIGVSAPERIVDLWTGLEALTPVPPHPSAIGAVTAWLDGIEAITPGFRRAAVALAAPDLADLLAARRRLASLPGITSGLASRMTGQCRTLSERLAVGAACIYAIRNGVIHGSVSARTTQDINAIRAAEALAWIFLDARLSHRLCGAIPLPVASRLAVAMTL